MDWNYDPEAAPKQTPVIVTTEYWKDGKRDVGETFRYTNGKWDCEPTFKVIAWMPMPDPAPLPEDHAKEEGK